MVLSMLVSNSAIISPDAFPALLMSKKKKKRSSSSEPGRFSGLYSRQALRAVVEALNLGEGHVLTNRTARRFLWDSNPNGHNPREFFLALGQTLQEMGFVPDLEPHLPLQVPSAQVYADSLEFAAKRWDAFMSKIQSESSWEIYMVTAGRCFVGLAAVDLSLRLLALNWITGFDAHLPDIPLWAEENGIGKILRSRLSDAGLTRNNLAARLKVSDTTVDNWLDGRTWPGREYVDALARESAGGGPDLASPLAARFRREFVLAKVSHLLAEMVGRDHVISAVDAVSRLARDLSEHVGPGFVPEQDRPVVASALLLAGSEFPLSPNMLRFLASVYPDGEWRDVILTAAVPWELAFGLALRSGGGPRSLAGKPMAGFRATRSRRIQVLYGMVV